MGFIFYKQIYTKKTFIFVICYLFLSLHLSLSYATNIDKNISNSEREVIAKVNGKIIYKDQLIPYTSKKISKYKKYGMSSLPNEALDNINKQELNKLIGQELLFQESQKYGLTPEKYLELNVLKSVRISEDEIKDYYEKHKNNFKQEDSVSARHILIKPKSDTSQEEIDKAREKAEKIRQTILDGGNFEEIAKTSSDCTSASKGGELGYIRKGYMPPEFDEVAFSLNINEISRPVKTKFGFHIIKITDKKTAGIISYENAKALIEGYLKEQRFRQKIAEHIDELKSRAEIEIFMR